MIMTAADQAVMLNLHRRYITLPFHCITDPKVTTRNKQEGARVAYDRAKLREEHFWPEDS